MKGSIDKRGEKLYQIRLSIGKYKATVKNKKTGLEKPGIRRLYHTETIHGTRKEAESRLRDLLREHEGGTLAERSTKTLNDHGAEWFRSIRSRVKERTHVDYGKVWKRYIEDTVGRLPLNKITPSAIQRLYNDLSERSLGAATVRRVHFILSKSLEQAIKLRLLSSNPTKGLDLPKQMKSKVVRSMDEEQAQLFLAATHGERWETLWLVALQTGMRPEEYQGLFWTDFDFARHTCHIQRALVRPTGGAWKLEETKTQSGDRVIRIDPRLVAELKKHRARQAQERLLAGPEWDGTHPFVFTNERGGPVNHCNLARRSFKPLIKKAGLPDKFCPYDLRHTFATLMLKSGEDIKTVSEVLGHKDIQITLSFYHHCLPKMHHDAATRAADLFSPPANPAHLSRTDRTKRARTGGDG